MKHLAWLVLSIAVLALTATSASADKPVKEPVPAEDFVLGPEVCGFPVLEEILVNRESQTTFSDGRVHISGAAKVRLTNLDNGKSLVQNASGPVLLMFPPDGSILFRSSGLLIGALPNTVDGVGPGLFLFTGRHDSVIDPITGNPTSLGTLRGHQVDLCALLR